MGRPATTAYVDRFICLTEQTLAAASGLSVSRARRLCDALSEEKLDYNLPKKKKNNEHQENTHSLPTSNVVVVLKKQIYVVENIENDGELK